MTIKNIKLNEALTGGPDWKVRDMSKFMKEKKVRQVYIVENNSIIGVVGMTDIVYEAVATGNIDVEAREIMNSPVIYAKADISPKEAYFLMANNNIFLLPVLENGVVIGELSLNNAFEALKQND